MIPSKFINTSKAEIIYYSISLCLLGSILVAYSDKGICAILFHDDADELVTDLQKRFPQAELIKQEDDFKNWRTQIINFVNRPKKDLKLHLDMRGTVFQKRVWRKIQNIPLGTTASYSDIAKAMGEPKAARAVATACAANPIALLVPCHRVVRSDGGISGYRWGIENKRILITREAKAINHESK